MRRIPVNKYRSVKQFRRTAARTRAPNVAKSPQRGGWRL